LIAGVECSYYGNIWS